MTEEQFNQIRELLLAFSKRGVKPGLKTTEFYPVVVAWMLVCVDTYFTHKVDPILYGLAVTATTAYIGQRGYAKRNDGKDKPNA